MGLIGKFSDSQIVDLTKKLVDLGGGLWFNPVEHSICMDDAIEGTMEVMTNDAMEELMARSENLEDFYSKIHAYCKKKIPLLEKAQVAKEVISMVKELKGII